MRVMYCEKNGHYIGSLDNTAPPRSWTEARTMLEQDTPLKNLPKFCPTCGSTSLGACKHCNTAIESRGFGQKPAYFGGCGKPFPWTETALLAAKEYTDDLTQLSAEEKAELKATFEDLISETPRTAVAANRFQKFIGKIGPAAGDVLKSIIVNIATEAAKRLL